MSWFCFSLRSTLRPVTLGNIISSSIRPGVVLVTRPKPSLPSAAPIMLYRCDTRCVHSDQRRTITLIIQRFRKARTDIGSSFARTRNPRRFVMTCIAILSVNISADTRLSLFISGDLDDTAEQFISQAKFLILI